MKTEFKYELGEEVILPSGQEGKVIVNSVCKGMTEPRVTVSYYDKNGAQFDHVFDESELSKRI